MPDRECRWMTDGLKPKPRRAGFGLVLYFGGDVGYNDLRHSPRHLWSGSARRCVIQQCEEYGGMNEQIKFPSRDEISDAVLLVLAFPRNPEAEGSVYLEDLERGVLRVLNWPDDDLTRNEYLTRIQMFKDPNTGEESHLKYRIWSTVLDSESRGHADVSAHTLVTPNTVVQLTPEGHTQAQGVRAKVVDACLLQRIPPRECSPMAEVEPPNQAVKPTELQFAEIVRS
jgi:hypothetical protein